MVEPRHLDQLLHPMFSPADEKAYRASGMLLASGLAASPGAGVGRLVFNAEDAEEWQARGEKVRQGGAAPACCMVQRNCLGRRRGAMHVDPSIRIERFVQLRAVRYQVLALGVVLRLLVT